MKTLIYNEIRIFFSKRNIGIFIIGCLSMIVIFCFYFVPEHNNYILSQVHYYEQMVTSDATRSKIITEQINRMKEIGEDTEKLEKSRDFWQADLENCRLVSYNLEHENASNMAKAMIKRDKFLQKVIDEGGDLSSYSIMLRNDERDLKNRIELQDIYMKNQFYGFVYEKMPTAYYMLSNFFVFGGIPIIVILACVILSDFDCWSKDFESNTYKLLFTMTGSRAKIYLARTIVTTIATMTMSLMMIGILFVLGYFTYGLGDEVFVIVKNTFVPISTWCMNNLMITIVLLVFLSTMIQVLSLLIKNSGISLLVPCLCMLVILTDIDLFNSIFSINPLILWIIILSIAIIHFCMVKYLERIDLNGTN